MDQRGISAHASALHHVRRDKPSPQCGGRSIRQFVGPTGHGLHAGRGLGPGSGKAGTLRNGLRERLSEGE